MNSWSTQRKIMYLSIGLALLFVVVVIPVFYFFYKSPTCADGKRNGDETGVDCGGTCQLLCSVDTVDPIVLWARAFPVSGDIYSVAAYIQNPNINSEALASYEFTVYDAQNVLIATRRNTTIIQKNKVLAIFEPNIDTKGRVPARTVFEFTQKPVWRKNTESVPGVIVTQKTISNEGVRPRVDATIENHTNESVERIEVIALVYNEAGNAVAASRTFIDRIEPDQLKSVVFTWSQPFAEAGASSVVEIIPRIIPTAW